MPGSIELKNMAIIAVVELETKLHFDRDHDGAHTLTRADCDQARAAVTSAVHVLPSVIRDALLYRIANAEAWLASSGARGTQG